MSILDWFRSKPSARRRIAELQARAFELRLREREARLNYIYGPIAATYDAAQTTDDNSAHWAAADALSPDAANSYSVRKILRQRARYEQANNGYLRGMVAIHTYDVVGEHGPRLQMLLPDPALNEQIEKAFASWAAKIRLGMKLRLLQMAYDGDGEGFALKINNPKLRHKVNLDLRPFECDRVHDTAMDITEDPENVDGVILDEAGNPEKYFVLKAHPGSNTFAAEVEDADTYDADEVIHWFARFRPEQHRGIPQIMPSLPLGAQLRRYTLATLDTAETAANISGVVKTNAPANGEAEGVEAMESIQLERSMFVTMPEGWDISQVTPTQPSAQYSDFKSEIVTEMGRPLLMPRNMSNGNSSPYNFASAKVDDGPYWKGVGVVQREMALEVMDSIFASWLEEAKKVYEWQVDDDPAHEWLWQGREARDPREANSETERLGSGAITLPTIYADRGLDWRTELTKGAEALGVSIEEYQELIRQKIFKVAAAGGQGTQDGKSDEVVKEMVDHALRK
jgi:capsid protein